ncbi:UDP-Gal or UDP-GlcNAc-dependent glycosyltransferase [Trypanosoma grayi]|uniref:UDP-Gal or UDP-GlcNAc-dependent glycosyltransferase n=1 Tax=Trypanosoma grayi TaxID=71804 RepID=UPI0004F3F054|nr:UDP-Gal or UDP-GlcNAc-dependent glycosyltransferase [Trypanosoma grayi]KEG07536.1 UDP-Gal or UDP-GlcNAc-dependent glycosyltransferase [Trypanosoma grayi]
MAHRHPLRVFVACVCSVVLAAIVGLHRVEIGTVVQTSTSPSTKKTRSTNTTFDEESLQYIPRGVVRTWSERGFLIVFGIPSADIEGRRRRRYLQRASCWRFPNVATKLNDFTGAMLVLYIMGRHPSHNFTYSAALKQEAAEWHDVIALPMNEGRSSTNKEMTGRGRWGIAAEVGMSRKTFLWFEMALRLLPRVSYIAKGDDDIFLRVPQFLADLQALPRQGVYWGLFTVWNFKRNRVHLKIRFAAGMCYTLSRDVAEQLLSYEPLYRLMQLSYSQEREEEFISLSVQHEDVMVGRVLLMKLQYQPLVSVEAASCSFHEARGRRKRSLVTWRSVAVHHVHEGDYAQLMARFTNAEVFTPRLQRSRSRAIMRFLC